MAVFTQVAFDDAAALAARLSLGSLRELRGITAGIENTNYFLICERGDYVLTVFERLSAAQRQSLVGALSVFAEAAGEVPDDAWMLGWST